MIYAVVFEIDENEICFSRGKSPFTESDPVMTFTCLKEAEKEAKKWQTGRVVEYSLD